VPGLDDPGRRLSLVRQYGGHSLAYACLQPAMRYCGDAEAGFAACRKNFGQYTFLGDPICEPTRRRGFLENLVRQFPNALFMQIHEDTARCLADLGYAITPVGVENEIDTTAFTLSGKRMADLRHYRNKARAGGVSVAEVSDSVALRAALQPISDAWLPQKSWFARELEFLARPFVSTPEPAVRIFTGRVRGQLAAFVILDPMFNQGLITGYTVSILRHLPHLPEGTVDFIVLHTIAALAAQAIPVLSLGVSPFYHMDHLALRHGRGRLPVYLLYRALSRWGDPIYHFRGLSFHKSRYRAREVPVFTAVRGPLGLWPLYASARACRML
jgi:lysylphosphatidylglycerol synthetase-like protein (DUF2156 family)